MRRTYGPDQPYTKMAAHAMRLWKEHDKRWNCRLFRQTGVLWMATVEDDQYERASLPLLHKEGVRFEELSSAEMTRRWPQINFEDVRWGIHEPDGGFLCAKAACQEVVNGFVAEGGEYRQEAVRGRPEAEYRKGLMLSGGSKLVADQYVFACGPWLGKLFPETIGDLIRPSKQDVFFFGALAGDDRFSESQLPVWADHRERFIYGIPASDGHGFKIADDTRGRAFDPTSGERTVNAETLEMVRDYLGFRFPAMKDARLVETQVCQYENTPDNNFIIDRHPRSENVWIVGGGSGHGFKHGPAIGEMVAGLVMEGKNVDAMFRLERFRQNRVGEKR
jgi:sarcosine oxidase